MVMLTDMDRLPLVIDVLDRYWSSSGAHADFARGTMYSDGGQAFIVLHSTTRMG